MIEISAQLDQKQFSLPLPDLVEISTHLNAYWADAAARRVRENYSGGPGTNYLQFRSGKTADTVAGMVRPGGASVSVTGPGVFAHEYGATTRPKQGTPVKNRQGQVVKYIPFLRFRLFQPGDTDQPTGRWILARKVTIPARHPVQDAAEAALAELDSFMLQAAGGSP